MTVPRIIVHLHDDVPVALGQGESISAGSLAEAIGSPEAFAAAAVVESILPELVLSRAFDSLSPDELATLVAEAIENDDEYSPPDFERYLELVCPEEFDTGPLIEALNVWFGVVEFAYEATPTEPTGVVASGNPRFGEQTYLTAGPVGIGVQAAWDAGVDGTGTTLIDIEHAAFLGHEDLPSIPVLAGTPLPNNQGHGTATLSIIAAVDNTTGIVGIAPGTSVRYMAPNEPVAAGAVQLIDRPERRVLEAARILLPGDVLVLELSAGGGPVERLEHMFHAIRLATAKGIIVVEAAGNGGHDLDTLEDDRGIRSLARGTDQARESFAVLVGGCTSAAPHALWVSGNPNRPGSCFGARIDCYAWAEDIRAAGSFTDPVQVDAYFFMGGTSGATAIIAGVCVLVQHCARTLIGAITNPLTPKELRRIVSSPANGTPLPSPAEPRVMPDFAKIIANEFV